MSTEEKARELQAKERQQEGQTHESMLKRSHGEVANPIGHNTDEKARELLAEARLEEHNLQESILERSQAELHTTP
jgi:DNA polymerase III delta prime subunit